MKVLYQLSLTVFFLFGSLVHGSENLKENDKESMVSQKSPAHDLNLDLNLDVNEKEHMSIEELPTEIICHTLKFLSLQSLAKIEQISSRFRTILQLPDVWRWNLKQIGIKNVETPKLECIKNRQDINLRYEASTNNEIIEKLYNDYNNIIAKKQEYKSILKITSNNLEEVHGAVNIGIISFTRFERFLANYNMFNQQCLDLDKKALEIQRKLKIATGIGSVAYRMKN